MNWLDRAEARFGHLAISGLPHIVVGFNLLVFILHKVSPDFLHFIDLNPGLILQGQVWRLVSFIFIPQFGSIFGEWVGILFYLMFLLFVGTGLEQAMGAFKLNLYYLVGVVCVATAAMLFGPGYAAFMLNSSLFFAFARYFPDTVIYVMFILPVKVKWMAWFSGALLLLGFLANGRDYRAAVIASLINYVVFFGGEHLREARLRSQVTARRQRFETDRQVVEGETLHECSVCGVTEAKDPYMDFRVARDGKEYCSAHLPKVAPQTAT